MLTQYIRAAMRNARYEILPEDGQYYGETPALHGVFAHAPTLEACREQLEEVLEEWILLCLSKHIAVPVLDGIDLRIKDVA